MSITTEQRESEQDAKSRLRKTVTLSDEAIETGEKLAAAENRNFSNYVETLILRDAGQARAKLEEVAL